MSRSVKKGPYVEESLALKVAALNQQNDKNWLKVLVKGTDSNRSAVGARVSVYDAGLAGAYTVRVSHTWGPCQPAAVRRCAGKVRRRGTVLAALDAHAITHTHGGGVT